jgi:hypothetical protein
MGSIFSRPIAAPIPTSSAGAQAVGTSTTATPGTGSVVSSLMSAIQNRVIVMSSNITSHALSLLAQIGLGQRQAPQDPFPTVPNEIIQHISSFLDRRSTLAFAGTSHQIRNNHGEAELAELHQFETSSARSLALINQDNFDDLQTRLIIQPQLRAAYNTVLSQLFVEHIDKELFPLYADLAEKFLKHMPKHETQLLLKLIFRGMPDDVQQAMVEKIATHNLPLAINLISTLPQAKFPALHTVIAEKFSTVFRQEGFLANFQASSYNSVLHFALATEQENIALALLRASPSAIDTKDLNGNTLLILAASMDDFNLVHTLITEFNAQVNLQNKEGRTALMEAQRVRDEDTVELLRQHGADETLTDNEGYTT